MSADLNISGDVPATNRAILIRVKNAGQLASAQGSAAGLMAGIAPAMIEGKVYDEVSSKLRAALKTQGVDADVSIVEPNSFRSPADNSPPWQSPLFIAGGVGVLGLLGYLMLRRS